MRYPLKTLFVATLIAAICAWRFEIFLIDPIATLKELDVHYQEPFGDHSYHYVCITSPPIDNATIDKIVSAINRTGDEFHIYLDEIPDNQVYRLWGLKNVPEISIAESDLGNAGLTALSNIDCLKRIEIERCANLNHDGVTKLRTIRPDIAVYGWWHDFSDPDVYVTVLASPDGTDERMETARRIDGG